MIILQANTARWFLLVWAICDTAASAAVSDISLTICENSGCKTTQNIILSPSQWTKIAQHLSPSSPNPARERAAIAKAIAEFEKVIGTITATSSDMGGNNERTGQLGELDCISESTNTQTYLRILQQNKLLHWHTPVERVYRRPYIFDPHWSAAIKSNKENQIWAVDSWPLDNGLRPFVQPLSDWKNKRTLPYNPDAE